MYKFLQNLEWTSAADKYTVGVMSDPSLLSELKTITSGRSVKGLPVEVLDYQSGNLLDGLHMLFVGAGGMSELDDITRQAVEKSVVIVTETNGSAKYGAGINFVDVGGTLKFQMNLGVLQESNVKASGSIKSLAILID